MDSSTIAAIVVLAIGIVTLVLIGAGEAGVIAGVRERVLREPAESRVEALRRFYQERQLTLSALTLARNLASVAVTGVATYLVLREATDTWPALAVTIVAMAVGFVVLQAFTRSLVARDPHFWQRVTWPLVVTIRFLFRIPVLMLDAPLGALMHAWHRHVPANEVEEELLLVAEMEEASAALPDAEREMIRGVMDLEFTAVREVMVPRTDIIAIDVEDGFEALAQLMVEKGVSRVPVYEEDIDHILGIAHSKEVIRHLANGPTRPVVRDILRPVYTVPETKRVHELLAEMRARRISIAVVVDEYGGTAGLVTLEDLIEEIVGEIQDEFDQEEQPVEQLSEREAILDARVSIDELNEMFDTEIEKEDFDSVGGFIVNELGRMPNVGDTVQFDGVSLKVLSVAGRRIKKVRVQRVTPEPTQASGETGGR
jgi:CBS domain containing-hemolysin-like protein